MVVQGIALLGEYTRRDQHGTNKRYGIFSAVNWTLMYDVEHHGYATAFPSNAQVFHFKPESRPLTMKQEPGILDYNCPVAVSYTHLDVYKRQGQNRAFRCSLGRRRGERDPNHLRRLAL